MNVAAENRCRNLITQLKELRIHAERERAHFEQEQNFLDAQLSLMEAQLQTLHAQLQLKTGVGQEASSAAGFHSSSRLSGSATLEAKNETVEQRFGQVAASSPSINRTLAMPEDAHPKPPSSSPPALQSDLETASISDKSSEHASEAEEDECKRRSISDDYLPSHHGSFGVVVAGQDLGLSSLTGEDLMLTKSPVLAVSNFPDASSSLSLSDTSEPQSPKEVPTNGRKKASLQSLPENQAQISKAVGEEPECPAMQIRLPDTDLDPHRVSRMSNNSLGPSLGVPGQVIPLSRRQGSVSSLPRDSRTSLGLAAHVGRTASQSSTLLPAERDSTRRASIGAPGRNISTRSSLRVVQLHASEADDDDAPASWCLLPQWDQLAWKATRNMARRSMDCDDMLVSTRSFGNTSLIDSVKSRTRSFDHGKHGQIVFKLDENMTRMSFCMLQPNSMINLIWLCISITFIVYELITIPLLALQPYVALFDIFDWCTAVFWTLDIPKAFLTGVIDNEGQVDTRPKTVAVRYIKSNFFLDIICVTFHWFSLGFNHCNCTVGVVLQVLRFLRVWKLWRLSRSPEVEVLYMEYMQSEELILLGQVALNIMELLASGHIIACIWYGLAATHVNDSNWVNAHFLNDSSLLERYVWAIHWALAQFTGELVYSPENVKERLFTCVVLFVTFIISCFFVSSITGAVTRLAIIRSTQSKQMAQLRRYLDHHHISAHLAVRIQHNATHAISEQKRNVQETDVTLLTMISEPLRRELHFEMHAPSLISHGFFTCYHDYVSPECIQKVCHQAVTSETLREHDSVFSNNELPVEPKMYFINTGRLEYAQDGLAVKKMEPGGSYLHASEANLWTRWMHVGALKSVIASTILSLDSEEFASIVCIFPTCHAHNYAEGFVALLNNCDKSTLSDLVVAGAESLKYEAFPEIQVRRSVLSETGRGSSRRGSDRIFNNDRLPSFLRSATRDLTGASRGSIRGSIRGSKRGSIRGSQRGSIRHSLRSIRSSTASGVSSMGHVRSCPVENDSDSDEEPFNVAPTKSC